ncbi:MAG: type VI secretion system tip protein VgrG [Planctomycetes bacterium]|nr:type VI secretion system tip protein VgrG [Planctomycetota bacterium]
MIDNRPVKLSGLSTDFPLEFRGMVARERLGSLFQIDLDLLSDDEQINLEQVLGQNVTVHYLTSQGGERHFNGMVTRFSYAGRAEQRMLYRATLNPWLWFLTRTADCRIFQEKSVPEIMEDIFRELGFTDFDAALRGSHPKRDYCVQYRESDFNFISRLMEDEGIYYYFRHEEGKHTLILADSIETHEPVPGYEQVPYIPPRENEVIEEEHIEEWSLTQEIQTATYALNDYDFERPRADLQTRLNSPFRQGWEELEVYDYPGNYKETGVGDEYVRTRIEELNARFERAKGAGDVSGLFAGALFHLTGYPREDQNREYLVVAVRHELKVGEYRSGVPVEESVVYSNKIVTMDGSFPFRSPRLTRKPFVQGPQTAVVVGKKGEEIWTDEHGRVKVQFHWDRLGKFDENSSCWVRVAQVWAGKNWGGIQLPRIGQEVIVDFLEGDPDRPIITGRVYNGDNKTPYKLPDFQTISGIKSNSSKSGGGFNEIRMEDKKGEEQLYIHAQKNQDIRVKNDCFETIEHDRHLVVKNNRTEKVEGNCNEEIGADHKEKIGKDRNLEVVGKEAKKVGGSLSLTVEGNVIAAFNASHNEQTKEEYSLLAKNVVIEATNNVTIRVGDTFVALSSAGIKIGTNGEIVLDAKKSISQSAMKDITLEAMANATVKGTAGASFESPASAKLSGTETTVKGDALTTIQGGVVKIN